MYKGVPEFPSNLKIRIFEKLKKLETSWEHSLEPSLLFIKETLATAVKN